MDGVYTMKGVDIENFHSCVGLRWEIDVKRTLEGKANRVSLVCIVDPSINLGI